jgi:acyl-CoA thioesterase
MARCLARSTAVAKLERAPGWYVAELDDGWSYVTPSGGVLMTVAMRAMAAELGDASFSPISATTLFCSPVPAGPLEIRVEVLRRGPAAAQLRAALSSTSRPGPGLEVSATFGRARASIEAVGLAFPEVAMPDACGDAGNAVRVACGRTERPFFGNFDMRLAYGSRIWEPTGWSAGDARWTAWYRYRVSQRLSAGVLDPFALPPIADTMPGALANMLGPDVPFFAPSLDLTVHFVEATEAEWLLVDARCHRAHGGYATASADIWDDRRRLVARTTQTMILRDAASIDRVLERAR